jgi:hypothetical protein
VLQPLLQWQSDKYYMFRECVFVVLGIRHAKHVNHIFFYGLSSSTIFFNIISQWHDFRKKVTENEICVLILCTTFVCGISHCKKN